MPVHYVLQSIPPSDIMVSFLSYKFVSLGVGSFFTLEKYCSKLMIPVVHFRTVTFASGIQTKLSTKLENVHGAYLLR